MRLPIVMHNKESGSRNGMCHPIVMHHKGSGSGNEVCQPIILHHKDAVVRCGWMRKHKYILADDVSAWEGTASSAVSHTTVPASMK